MAEKNKTNKNTVDNDNEQKEKKRNNIVDTKTQEIVKAFQDEKLQGNASYFSSDKKNVISDFRAYVTEHYGDGMLITLQKEGKIDHAFNEISDRGFTIADFFNIDKKETIRQQIGSTTSESQAISQSCIDCYTNWLKLSEESKKKISFDEFIINLGYDVKRDEQNRIISISLKKTSKIQSISSLDASRKEFVRTKTENSELIKIWDTCMDTSHFDPTEKIVCVTTVRSLYDRIQKIDGSKRTQLNELLEDVFGKNINTNTSFSALTSWTNLSGLNSQLEDFFAQLSHLGLSEKEIESLKALSIDPEKCLHYGEQSKELVSGTHEKSLQIKKFSELDKKVQKICDKLVTTNIINTVDQVIETVETDIKKIGTIFDMPGSMSGFFKQFTPDLDKISASDRQEYQNLKHQESSYRDKIDDTIGEEREKLIGEYQSLRQKIAEKEKIYYTGTTIDFFDSIGRQVTQAHTTIGKSNDLLGGQVSQVLQKLYHNGRDMSLLSDAEQNICMRASVAMQLAKVKDEGGVGAMGYDFDQYAQFVSELYDFTSKKSVLKTKDGQSIELNFEHKRFVGKPNPGETIDITSGFKQGLDALHVEFELDIKDNLDAANFLKMITGGNSSQLFQKITDQTGEQLITESSRVEMTGPDGIKYQGYLSPALLDDMSVGDDDVSKGYTDEEKDSMKNSSDTFVLYSKPVDQLHDDRIVETVKEGGIPTKNPIYINPSNAKDWKIDILDHRVTLNDAKINVLPLGHIMAQEYDKQQLLNKEITQGQDNDIEKKLNNLKDVNFHDKDTNPVSPQNITQESEKEIADKKDWNAMFPDNNKEGKEPGVGMRFALQVENVVTSKIGADDPKLLSATIKKVDTLPDGQKAITFSFDTLTRSGSCSLKDVTLSGSQLAVFKNKETFKNITYLGTDEDTKKSYPELLTHLASTFEKEKNKYNFGLFSGLDLKDGKFMKGKEPVSFIIPAGQVASQLKEDKNIKDNDKNYLIEYTVEKSGDQYHIKSSGYHAEKVNKKGEKESIQVSFDMKTDLSGVLILLAGKNIAPYTSDEKKILTTEHGGETLPQKDRKARSFSTLWAVLKSGGKSAIDGIKKKRGEKKEEELKFVLFNDMKLYHKLSAGPLGKLLGKFDLNVFSDLADDADAGGMEFGWKKIEAYRTQFEKFHPAYNAGVGFGLPMMEKILSDAVSSYKQSETCSYEQRLKVAAVLLYMLKNMKSGYSKELSKYPRGTYIKILMGPKAYESYMNKYKELEKKSQKNTTEGTQSKERLVMLEYNFIIDNTRGGGNFDESIRDAKDYNVTPGVNTGYTQPTNSFYFQNIYSKKFAGELSPLVSGMKETVTDKNADPIKGLISQNNFAHIYNDCKDHLHQGRINDAVNELVALQHTASNKEESNKVFMLMMIGILNGAFVHNLGKDTKEALKGVFRNSSMPFPNRVTHYDAQKKIQAMLQLTTADMGEKSFSKLSYSDGKTDCTYDANNFDHFSDTKHQKPFVLSFESWMSDPKINERIMGFLHMDPSSMKTDDNLIHINKSIDPELKIFGHKVDPFAKKCVNEILGELYYNNKSERGTNISNYNDSSELSHTASTIDDFYKKVNVYKGNTFTGDGGDHADVVWGQLENNAPDDTIVPGREYKLAHDVNEFFRVFQGIGIFRYDKNAIEDFYKDMIFAKSMPGGGHDRMRLIWFNMTNSLLKQGNVPGTVENTFIKYMQYFEKNIDMFTQDLGKTHSLPDDENKTFEYIFNDQIEERIYIPSAERDGREDQKKKSFINQCNNRSIKCINDSMKKINDENLGIKGNNRQNVLGKKIDVVWQQMRKGADWSSTKESDTSTTIIRNLPRVINGDKVDLASIKSKKKEKTVGGDKNSILRTIDPKYMTPEQREEEKRIKDFRLLQERYGMGGGYEDAA